MTNFGATFKKARESKGISLDQIANETRISTRFLKAIENEEFDALPGGIFNRGFVRTFAAAVGLDPDQAVADYERLSSAREPVEMLAEANAPPAKAERNLYPIAIGILGIAVAIFYLVSREPSRPIEVHSPRPVPAKEVPAPTPGVLPGDSSAPAPVLPADPPSTPVPAPLATEPGSHALKLDIQAVEKTWIKVTSDGAANPGEVLEPGMTRKFTAGSSIDIFIGNAAGLTLKINDMPLKPLGKSGEVRTVKITPANLKDFIG